MDPLPSSNGDGVEESRGNEIPQWTDTDEEGELPPHSPLESVFAEPKETFAIPSHAYYPLLDTLRLYAGWLLAWYFVIEALGSYQYLRRLPFQLSALDGLFRSLLVIRLSAAAFLFLLLSTVHCMLGRGIAKGIILTLVGIVLLGVFVANT
ncbi:MAG: hypothetical protein WCS85_01200 [Candidatus Peribacteraceae bacterium]|jgi:hypothetical protein